MPPSTLIGLEHLATPLMVANRALCLDYANPAAENLFEISSTASAGLALNQLFFETGGLIAACEAALATGVTYTEHEILLSTATTACQSNVTVSTVGEQRGQLLIEFHLTDKSLKIVREERMQLQQEVNRELLRNLAHEIKNPLGGIRGAAQLLEHELPKPGLREYTQVIIKEADRLQGLMDRLLAPNRPFHFTLLNMHEVMERVRSLILAEYPELRIRRDYDLSLPELMAGHEQLVQIMLNVARNAAQAMQGRGDIVFQTRIARRVTLGKRAHRLALEISIIDNGPGIAPDIREKIFYPLVTSKEEGTGLGLTIAQTYVHQHGGTLDCESQPGQTVFTVLLPYNLTEPLPP